MDVVREFATLAVLQSSMAPLMSQLDVNYKPTYCQCFAMCWAHFHLAVSGLVTVILTLTHLHIHTYLDSMAKFYANWVRTSGRKPC